LRFRNRTPGPPPFSSTSFGSCWKLGRTSHATGFFIPRWGNKWRQGWLRINSIAPLLSPKRSKQRPLSSHDRRSNRGPAEIRPLREACYRAPRSSDASDHCEEFAGESIKAIRPNKLVRLQAELSQSRGTRLPQNMLMAFGGMPERASTVTKVEFVVLLGFCALEWLAPRPVRLCLANLSQKVAAIVNAGKPCRLGGRNRRRA
jgi:hypothetical protein